MNGAHGSSRVGTLALACEFTEHLLAKRGCLRQCRHESSTGRALCELRRANPYTDETTREKLPANHRKSKISHQSSMQQQCRQGINPPTLFTPQVWEIKYIHEKDHRHVFHIHISADKHASLSPRQ
jgi:hypothetical protein